MDDRHQPLRRSPCRSFGVSELTDLSEDFFYLGVLGFQVAFDLHAGVEHGVAVLVGGLGSFVSGGRHTFWPTMMMLRSTNWRNVWLIQDTRVTALPDLMAEGSDTKARAAKT